MGAFLRCGQRARSFALVADRALRKARQGGALGCTPHRRGGRWRPEYRLLVSDGHDV